MEFDEIYKRILTEATFRKSKQVRHLYDLPMFSVFVYKELGDEVTNTLNTPKVKEMFKDARNTIAKIGFPAMHSNVVFRDLSDRVNQNTGGGSGGYAYPKGKYLVIDPKSFLSDLDYARRIITHEWAHLWMFNNSKGFKDAVKEYYNQLLGTYKSNLLGIRDKKEKNVFSHSIKTSVFNADHFQTDELVGYDFSDVVYTKIVKQMMFQVRNFYHGYIYNRYAEDDYPFKEDEKTFYTEIRKAIIENTKKLIVSIINDVSSKANVNVDVNKYDKQITYLSNAIWKVFYKDVGQYIARSVRNDESDFKWDKEEGKEWTSRFESPLQYLEGLTNSNEDLVFDNKIAYNDLAGKFISLGRKKYDPPSMIIELAYNIVENQINAKRSPESATNLGNKSYNTDRSEMAKLVGWVNEYGMSNDDEIWATGIEYFFKLKPEHRKSIIKLMSTTGERSDDDPNRSKRKMLRRREISNRKIQ